MATSPESPTPRWRTPAAGQASTQRSSRIFLVLVLMCALLGAAVAWFLLLRQPPQAYFVPMVITEYSLAGDLRWTHVKPWVEHDRDRLKAVTWLGELPWGAGVNAPANTQVSQDKTRLMEELHQNIRTYSSSAPLVIYLNAYAVWREGKVYVLPANVQWDNLAGTGLPLGDLVAAIAASPAPNKLLILDVTRPLTVFGDELWQNDDVADHIEETLRQVPNCPPVLCSCERGQVSLLAAELGGSVFGHYLERGLLGAADADQNHRVSVRELVAYLAARVDQWAITSRQSRQTPWLFPRDSTADFFLVYDDPTALADEALPANPGPFVVPPLGGNASPPKSGNTNDAHPYTLALALANDTLTDADKAAVAELRRGARIDKAKLTALQTQYKDQPAKWAGLIFQAASEDQTLTAAKVAFFNQLLMGAEEEGQEPAAFAETVFFYRLAKLVPRAPAAKAPPEGGTTNPGWPEQTNSTVHLALGVIRDTERLAACDPGVFPWIREPLTKVFRLRHAGEVLLVTPGASMPAAAQKYFTLAKDAEHDIRLTVDRLQRAFATHDRAAALLPALPTFLVACLDNDLDDAPVRDWRQAVEAALELQKLLSQSPTAENVAPGESPGAKYDQKTFQLEKHLQSLTALTVPHLEDQKGPRGYRQLSAWLELPGLPTQQRQTIWNARWKLGQELHQVAEQSNPVAGGSSPEQQASGESIQRRQAARSVLAAGWTQLKKLAPTTAARQTGQAQRFAWLAARFQYEREDLRALDDNAAVLQFVSLAAGHYGDLARELAPPNEKPLGIAAGSVTEEGANYRLKLAGDVSKIEKPRIILPNGDEKEVTPAGALLPILAFLDVQDSRFIIQAEKGGAWFHYKASVPDALLAQTVAKPRLLLSWQDVPDGDDRRLPAALGDELRLPVNGGQACFLYVYNPTPEAQKLTVRGPGFVRPLAAPLPPRQFRRVPMEGAPPKEGDGWLALDGTRLHFTLLNDKDIVLQERDITLRLRSPEDYLAEPPEIEFQAASGELLVKLHAKPPSATATPVAAETKSPAPDREAGTSCEVRLHLPPDRNPSLDLTRLTKIVTAARLPEQDELQIKGIRLNFGRDEPGWAALDVGGAPRAFVYALPLNLDGRKTPGIPLVQPALHLRLKGNSTPLLPDQRWPWPSSQALAYQMEADNADDAAIEVLLVDADGQTPRAAVWTRPAGRQRLLRGYPVNNSLVLETRVGDWQDELPTKGLAGQYFLRARLLRNKTDIVDPILLPVTLDDTAPTDIAFIGLTEPVPLAPLLPVEARGEDRDTGIREVRFFFGEPKGEQPPEKFTKAKWDPEKGRWKADLPMMGIPLGLATVSVQFVNGAGLTKTATKQILVEAADAASAIKPGRVEGTVVEGVQPQPTIEVRLLDDKGKLKDSVKTDMNGKFAFKKVPPGEYFLFCEKPATKREARKRIVVKEGEVEKADLDLVLK